MEEKAYAAITIKTTSPSPFSPLVHQWSPELDWKLSNPAEINRGPIVITTLNTEIVPSPSVIVQPDKL